MLRVFVSLISTCFWDIAYLVVKLNTARAPEIARMNIENIQYSFTDQNSNSKLFIPQCGNHTRNHCVYRHVAVDSVHCGENDDIFNYFSIYIIYIFVLIKQNVVLIK